jgi:hypothetical protein
MIEAHKHQKGAGAGENAVCFHPNPGAFVFEIFLINTDARRTPGRTNFVGTGQGASPARMHGGLQQA